MSKKKKPKEVAAGIPGVRAALGISAKEMGIRRSVQALTQLNQQHGFDCPSCAWPDPDHRSRAEFCENGAKAVAWEATRKRVDGEFFAHNSLQKLREESGHWLESQGRLVEPMHRPNGGNYFHPISWEDAYALIVDKLSQLTSPNEAVFYTSGRTSNEAAFLYQLFARILGTNNLPDCSNMCHESSGVALMEAIGIGKGTVSLEDIKQHCDLMVIVGQNPGTNHPRMLSALEALKKRGGRIISINPLPEAGLMKFRNPQKVQGVVGSGTVLSDLHLPIRLGGDQALFAEVNRRLVEAKEIDDEFISQYCGGFEAAEAQWRTLNWQTVAQATGLMEEHFDSFVNEIRGASRIIVCWAMGITQHRNAVATIREMMNFLLLRGNIGKPGAGACPVRGHSNVQGDRTMGICEKPSKELIDSMEAAFGIQFPREPGFDVVESIEAMRENRVRFFMAMGGNFASATPDTQVTEEALQEIDFVVHVATKLNRTHLIAGKESVILPCLGRTERDGERGVSQFVTVEDSMSVVHASHGRLIPASPLLQSEPEIIATIGAKMFGTTPIDWESLARDYSGIRDLIDKTIPGFENFNKRIQEPNGFILPNPPRDNLSFHTSTGKAEFLTEPVLRIDVPDGCFILQTMRSHDQFNTTVYGLDDRYRGISGRRDVVFINPYDIQSLGLKEEVRVDIITHNGTEDRRLTHLSLIPYPTPRGCVATYFPEANILVPLSHTAIGSNTPASKSILVRIQPSTQSPISSQ